VRGTPKLSKMMSAVIVLISPVVKLIITYCLFQKIFSHREGKQSLVEQVQKLSLDVFEFGNLIGQGCNAAVYEAKFNQSNLQGKSGN